MTRGTMALLGAALVGGCQSTPDEPSGAPPAQVQPQAAVPNPVADSGSRAPRPTYPTGSMAAIVEQTAALVDGRVSSITYSFDETNGPRTNVVLSPVQTLVGPAAPSTITLRIFGGPVPEGGLLRASELPRFAVGLRYVVFLTNDDWFFSPVLNDFAFRVENSGGREILLAQEGNEIYGFDDTSFIRGKQVLAQQIGLELSTPFAQTPVSPPSPAEAARSATVSSMAGALYAYKPTGLKPTAFDGAFVEQPMVALVGGSWRQITASSRSTTTPADAGVLGTEGGK